MNYFFNKIIFWMQIQVRYKQYWKLKLQSTLPDENQIESVTDKCKISSQEVSPSVYYTAFLAPPHLTVIHTYYSVKPGKFLECLIKNRALQRAYFTRSCRYLHFYSQLDLKSNTRIEDKTWRVKENTRLSKRIDCIHSWNGNIRRKIKSSGCWFREWLQIPDSCQ